MQNRSASNIWQIGSTQTTLYGDTRQDPPLCHSLPSLPPSLDGDTSSIPGKMPPFPLCLNQGGQGMIRRATKRMKRAKDVLLSMV